MLNQCLADMLYKIANKLNGGRDNVKYIEVKKKAAGGYINAQETIQQSNRLGLSVADYCEQIWNEKGLSQSIMEKIAEYGALSTPNPYVVEIGAGTGLFLSKCLVKCSPSRYDVYETAEDWCEYLRNNYPVAVHKANGYSLDQTLPDIVDLVHAHAVFVYLPTLISWRYLNECVRVIRQGGYLVFDCVTEDCLTGDNAKCWFDAGELYPVLLSKSWIIPKLQNAHFDFVTSFYRKLGSGQSEYLVFKKQGLAVPIEAS